MANKHIPAEPTNRTAKNIPGVGLPAGSDYPNLDQIPTAPCKEVFWRKEVVEAFEIANNGYSFYKFAEKPDATSVFAKDLSGYFYRLNNATRCFEFLFEGFKDSTDYTRIVLPPQAPSFVGFNYLHQPVFPMNDVGRPILPKDDRGKTIFPYYENLPLFPVDDSGAVCVPLGDHGKPVFPRIPEEHGAYVPCDVNGRVVLPLDENGEPFYPRDGHGNILMPFIVLEDGSRRRAIYTADDGTPIFPFVNGEQALVMHDNEVLFQHEYQQKMMMLAQYKHDVADGTAQVPIDEQFYQQHAAQYQYQYDPALYQQQMMQAQPVAPKATAAPNLLQKQLLFLRKKTEKKDDEEIVEKVEKPAVKVPSDRPSKPNKEKQKAERYIPEPARRPHFKSFRRDEPWQPRNNRDYRDSRDSRSSRDQRDNRKDSREDRDRKSRESRRDKPRRSRTRSRSRSLTWSPIDRR